MNVFGFDPSRLQISGPQAFQDFGGFLSANAPDLSPVGEAARAAWRPVAYFLPEVRIKNPAAPANSPQSVGEQLPMVDPTVAIIFIAGGALALWVIFARR